MTTVLHDSISLVTEKQTLGVLDLDEQRFLTILRVPDPRALQALAALNYPTADEAVPVEARRILSDYLHEVTGGQEQRTRAAYQRIRRFNRLHRSDLDLGDASVFALLKRTVTRTVFRFVGARWQGIEEALPGLLIEHVPELLPSRGPQDVVHVIDLQSVTPKALADFERAARKHDATRLLVSSTDRGLDLGPTLHGADGACAFCDDVGLPDRAGHELGTGDQLLDPLLIALLDRELLAIVPRVLEVMRRDITITNAKRFIVDQTDLSAYGRETHRRAGCPLCTSDSHRRGDHR